MVKQVRLLRDQYNISPKDIYNFDEVRIYASPQDLHSQTLEFSSVRDPYARKIQNPKEAYTGNHAGSYDIARKNILPLNRFKN